MFFSIAILKKRIAAIFSFIALGFAIWFAAKKSAKSEAKVEAANKAAKDIEAIAVREVNEATAAAERQVAATQVSQNVQAANAVHADIDIDSKLRDRWQRD